MSYVSHVVQRVNRAGTITRFQLINAFDPAPLLTGTITSSTSSRFVTGTGTAFLTEVEIGDVLYEPDDVLYIGKVFAIHSDTSIVLESNAESAVTTLTYYVAGKLPLVTNGEIDFQLSRNGFGFLNTSMKVAIVDDAMKSFATMIETDLFQDLILTVTVDGDLYFFGVADLQQAWSRPLDFGRSQIELTFYTRNAFKKQNRFYSDDNQSFLNSLPEPYAPTYYRRFLHVFQALLFDFGPSGVTAISHRWIQEVTRWNDGTIQPYQVLNEMWFNAFQISGDRAFNQEASLDEVLLSISRAFFFRYGWSVTEQKNLAINVDAGIDGDYDIDTVTGETTYTDGPNSATVNTLTRVTENNNVLNQSKFVTGVIQSRTLPYGSVRYEREGVNHSGGRNSVYQIPNPIIADRNYLGAYSFGKIPFDPSQNTGGNPLYVLQNSGGTLQYTHPLRFIDPSLSMTAYDTPELNARLHMRMLETVRPGIVGTYLDLIDPMKPHETDFNDYVYVIVKGSWNVLDCTTEITESISIVEN